MFTDEEVRESHQRALEARRLVARAQGLTLSWAEDLRLRGFWGRLKWLLLGI